MKGITVITALAFTFSISIGLAEGIHSEAGILNGQIVTVITTSAYSISISSTTVRVTITGIAITNYALTSLKSISRVAIKTISVSVVGSLAKRIELLAFSLGCKIKTIRTFLADTVIKFGTVDVHIFLSS